MRKLSLIFFLFWIVASCNNDAYKFPQADIKSTVYPVDIHRYGKTLFDLNKSNFQDELKGIQNNFRLFLDADLNDSANIKQLYDYVVDTQLITIYNKTIEVYPT